MTNRRYEFIGKALFFPKEKLVVIGDMHLGYEESLRQRGLEVPIGQFEEATEELSKILGYIKGIYGKIEQIIFIGDIKHHFSYLASEKEEIRKLLSFLKKQGIDDNQVIFIRGNHEKNEKSGKYVDYYIFKDIAFLHGHREYIDIYDKKINLVVMGHIHPTITLEDKMKIKREKYKCFLIGKYKKKEFIILPSFISATEGVSMDEFSDDEAGGYDFSIIPSRELESFEVYACQDVGEGALGFGKLRDL